MLCFVSRARERGKEQGTAAKEGPNRSGHRPDRQDGTVDFLGLALTEEGLDAWLWSPHPRSRPVTEG